MSAFTPTETMLNELLRQRLAAAGCHSGRFEVSEPGSCYSLSGQKPNGRTLFFWEFSCPFHQLVGSYLQQHYDEQTAQLTIEVDVAQAQFRYSRLTKQQQAAEEAATEQRAAEQRRQLRRWLPPCSDATA